MGGEYPGTAVEVETPTVARGSGSEAVEGEAATVARGSGSEAVAESCGGTVLLTDNETRERRLREEYEAGLTQGAARRGSLET